MLSKPQLKVCLPRGLFLLRLDATDASRGRVHLVKWVHSILTGCLVNIIEQSWSDEDQRLSRAQLSIKLQRTVC